MKFEKYKFKDVKTLITEIENDLYNFSLKLQAYSKSITLHHLCVKSFLNKGKTLLALKSMIFLNKYALNTYEYFDSLFRFKEHLNNQFNYIDVVYEYMPVLKDSVSKDFSIDVLKNIYDIKDINEVNKLLDLDRNALLRFSSTVI